MKSSGSCLEVNIIASWVLSFPSNIFFWLMPPVIAINNGMNNGGSRSAEPVRGEILHLDEK
jgi:hypothetical protein